MSTEFLILFNLQIYALGFIILLSLNRTLFIEYSGWISLIINFLGLISTSNVLLNLNGDFQIAYDWISVGNSSISFNILLNAQTQFMLILVQGIAFAVNLYSTKYLSGDKGINRFFAFLNLFVLSMLGLVLAGNLVQLYFFWELVGFCSYLLIGFWYNKKSANAAAIKAFLLNRIGDALLLAGILMVYYLYGSFEFDIFTQTSVIQRHYTYLDSLQLQTLAVLLLFGGVVAKSAQFPLQVWLPDAMEGPTPSSALIHAATMVVSGVFLLGRISPIITEDASVFIAIVGGLTSVIGALAALVQHDIKKVLAFSTVSQLGFMVAAMGIGAVGPAFFHLTTHAFFKAGLFLCAGIVIHHLHHEQDMRKMGNLIRELPVVFVAFAICSAALVGLPFTSGFLSKESILNASLYYGFQKFSIHSVVPCLLLFTSFLTTIYVIRQVLMVFFLREYNPVEVILDSTKKTFSEVLKSIQDLVTAENSGKAEENVFAFIRSLGIYDLIVLALSLGALWFAYSGHPFHSDKVWFIQTFGKELPMVSWLPYTVGGILIFGLLIGYNTTTEEIKRYYFNEERPSWKNPWVDIFKRQFYLDNFYEKAFQYFLGHRIQIEEPHLHLSEKLDPIHPNRSWVLRSTEYIETRFMDGFIEKLSQFTLWTSQLSAKTDKSVIDDSVMGIFANIKSLGNKIRSIGQGNLQWYLLSLLIAFLTIALIVIIL